MRSPVDEVRAAAREMDESIRAAVLRRARRLGSDGEAVGATGRPPSPARASGEPPVPTRAEIDRTVGEQDTDLTGPRGVWKRRLSWLWRLPGRLFRRRV